MNMVPEEWAEVSEYKGKIHNWSVLKRLPLMTPRCWAFEISTVHAGVHILIYSKIMSKVWPDAGAVVRRLKNFIEDSKTMNGS